MLDRQVLVIGSTGQIASSLKRLAGKSSCKYHFAARDEADLGVYASLDRTFGVREPDLVINCAAYTAVDAAETEIDRAFAVNSSGPLGLAELCHSADIPLIHLSTDYVFNGQATLPVKTDNPIDPCNVYGQSKARGEEAVRTTLRKHLILRLAWVYNETGRNFLNTMLRLGREKTEIGVVDDQVGSPSYAGDLASAIDQIATQLIDNALSEPWGTYHLTNSGSTSWHGFASKIFELAEEFGYPKVRLTPINTSDFPTAAPRPQYSVLDCSKTTRQFGVTLRPWQDGLKCCLGRKLV